MKNPQSSSFKRSRVIPSFAFLALIGSTQAQLTWDPDVSAGVTPGGTGTWDTSTVNWWDGGSQVAWDNDGSETATFVDTGSNQIVSLDSGLVIGDLSYGGNNVLQFRGVADNQVVTLKNGGAVWDTGGGEIEFNAASNLDVLLTMSTGSTLTINGGGTFDTGERPNGADWSVSGSTLDVTSATNLLGNASTVGKFDNVKLAAGSTYSHQRNANQSYDNNWELGGGIITFTNRWPNNGNITVNGSISGNIDELVVDMNTTGSNRILQLNQTASYTSTKTTIRGGLVRLGADNALASSVLTLGGQAGANTYLDLNSFDQAIAGLQIDTGNTREIRNNIGSTTSILTIDVASGESYAYNANFAGSGIVSIVKNGDGTQTFGRGGTYTSALGDVTVNAGTLEWNNNNGATLSGSMNVGPGGILIGNGVVGSLATIEGGLSPGNSPGTMTFESALNFTSTAKLMMEIGSSSLFDVLLNDGGDTLTADGILAFDTTGYSATNGETFQVFENWGGFTGSFSSITGTDLGGGLSLDTSNLLTNGFVTVVPEPSAALLGGLGMLVLLRRRRD